MSDLDYFQLPKLTLRWLSDSPFEHSASEMGQELLKRGYAKGTIALYISSISHLAFWTSSEGIRLNQIDEMQRSLAFLSAIYQFVAAHYAVSGV